MVNIEITEALYRAVALARFSWENWDSEMIRMESFRLYYLVKCLQTMEEKKAAMQILKRHLPLHNAVMKRFKRGRNS